MAEEKINTAEDEISLKELILKLKEWYLYLLSKWKTILIAGVLGGALGLAYAFIKKPVYTATTTFVLEEGERGGGLGAYAGLASMAGFDFGSGGGIFQGDNILELYRSRKMIRETLLTTDTFSGKRQLLIDRFIEFNKLRETWEENPKLLNLDFSKDIELNKRVKDSVITKIVDIINGGILNVSKPDKKLSVIKVEVYSEDELFSKSFSDNIVEKVNQFYVETKTKKSMENVAVLQQQTDSVRRVLNNSIGGVASEIDANPNSNPAFQKLRVGSQKRQVDVQASGAVYQELVKNLELAKITLRKEKPLIQVIDEPILPLKMDKLRKIKGIILGGVLFSFLTIFFLVIKNIFNRLMLH